jgi:hypothetical protein
MPKYYFSFGSSHHDTHGRTLDGYYTTIEAPTEEEARHIYFKHFGVKWSGTYSDDSIPRKWGWKYLAFPYDIDDLCSQLPQADAIKLFGPGGPNRYPTTAYEAAAIVARLTAAFDLNHERTQ